VSGVFISNGIVSVYPGTVIAAFGSASSGFGFALVSGSQFLCKGLATKWNRNVAFNTVQEQPGTDWQRPFNGIITDMLNQWATATLESRFTDWSVLAQDAPHMAISNYTAASLRDCQFHGGAVFLVYPQSGGPGAMLPHDSPMVAASSSEGNSDSVVSDPSLHNCLFERVNILLDVEDGSPSSVQNDLFWRGKFNYVPIWSDAVIQNNLFDQTAIPDNSSVSGSYAGGYNAFSPTSTGCIPCRQTICF